LPQDEQRRTGSIPVSRTSITAAQQHGAAYVRTMVGEDWALVAVAGGAGGRLVGFVVVTPIASVVPLSL